MTTFCIMSAPTATDFEYESDARSRAVRQFAEQTQLGVLGLAAVLEQQGQPPAIFNVNDLYYDYLSSGGLGVDRFASFAADMINAVDVEVYGFSTICSSYPTTIRIAQHLKRMRPSSGILLGGPQASVTDLETLTAFPFVDYILRGESDETLPLLLAELANDGRLSNVPGLTWRSPSGPIRNPSAPVVRDLDCLPLPAFHLTGQLNGAASAPLEIGRGCPFSCTFCSTNDFFRRTFRLKSPERVLEHMRTVASDWGVRRFELTHDMFTVDTRRVKEFCYCLLAANEGYTWGCSARTDCVDEELLELMFRAGCRGIFFGVETGSQRLQRVIDKDLDLSHAREIISAAQGIGIETTVSMIIGFPEERREDVQATVDFYLDSLRHPLSSPQLNILAPLAETPLYTKYRDQLVLEELCSDMAHQGRAQNILDRNLIQQYPEIFPNFYLLPVPNVDRALLFELHEFLLAASSQIRWLLVALRLHSCGFLTIFELWIRTRKQAYPELRGWQLRAYYMNEQAVTDFVAFVRDHLQDRASPAVQCLTDLYRIVGEAKKSSPSRRGQLALLPVISTDVPMRAPGIYVLKSNWDVQSVIEHLKVGTVAAEIDCAPRLFRTHGMGGGDIRLIETNPLMAACLEYCNGTNTVSDIIDNLADRLPGDEASRRLAAECGLELLIAEGLIQVIRPDRAASSPFARYSTALGGETVSLGDA